MYKLIKIYTDSFKGLSIESWMLSIVMLINRTGSMTLPFLGIYMTDSLGFDIVVSGLILSCFGIGSVIGSWLGGFLTDKVGEYYIQALSLLLSVPMFALYPMFETPWGIAGLVGIQSVVSEMFRPANSVAIAKYAQPNNLTRAFSLNRMAINLGFSLGPVIGGILSSISYAFLFYANGMGALVAGLVYIYFFGQRQRLFRLQQDRKKRHVSTQEPLLQKELSPYKDVPFLIFCVICTVFSICFFQLLNALPIFYKNDLGLSKFVIGLLMGTNGLVVVMFEMLLVYISEKYLSIALTMLYGTLLCAVSYFLLGFEPGYATLFLSIALLSLGEILVLPFMATITALRAGSRNKGAYMGVNGMAFSIALIFAPILGTQFVATIGFDVMWIATAFVLLLCSIGFYYFIPKLSKPKTVF
jgi:predicted MFS family arabinose efflux permease